VGVTPTGPFRSASSAQPFTPTDERWRSRTFLPHFDVPGLVQHITFHLADSLPKEAIHALCGTFELRGCADDRQHNLRRRCLAA
jgi:putative transposase